MYVIFWKINVFAEINVGNYKVTKKKIISNIDRMVSENKQIR